MRIRNKYACDIDTFIFRMKNITIEDTQYYGNRVS